MIFPLKNNFILFLLSIIFSYVFVFLIPWSNWTYFTDLDNYLARIGVLFLYGMEGEGVQDYFGINILTSEILWAFLLINIPIFFSDIQSGLEFISFFSLVVYTHYTFRHSNIIFSLILLFNPIFIDLIMSQVRIALAFSLLILAYTAIRKSVLFSIFFLLCAVFIHTAAYVLIAVFFLIRYLNHLIEDDNLKYQLMLFLPIFLIIAFRILLLPILDFFQDERGLIYAANGIDFSSITFASAYLFFAVMLVFMPKRRDSNTYFDLISYVIFMCSLFFGLSLAQMYGSRFVAISFPLLIIAINQLKYQFRILLIFCLFIYQILYLSYWMKF